MAFFRWVNAVTVSADKEPLIVNMDEASLSYHLAGVTGTVVRTKPCRGNRLVDRSRLRDRRGNITYMASICSDPTINHALPQILLGNEHRFRKRLLAQVAADLPENIVLWREKSAWNNALVMQRYIRLLCDCLGPHVAERSVVLLVDMAPCHIQPSVWACARSRGIRMILVPAGMTGLLQPLDTHVFKHFRSKLEQLWLNEKSNCDSEQLPWPTWLKVISDAIQNVVVEKDWQFAFERTGLLWFQSLLTPKLLEVLGWDACPVIADGEPAIGQASALFPRRCRANVAEWVQWRPVPSFNPIQTLD